MALEVRGNLSNRFRLLYNVPLIDANSSPPLLIHAPWAITIPGHIFRRGFP